MGTLVDCQSEWEPVIWPCSYPEEWKLGSHKACKWMLIASLLMIVPTGNNPNIPRWWLRKHTVVHLCNWIALSNDKEQTRDKHKALRNHRSIKLSEGSQSPKVTCCMIPFSWHFRGDTTTAVPACQGWGKAVATKGHRKGVLRGDGTAPCTDHGGGYTDI